MAITFAETAEFWLLSDDDVVEPVEQALMEQQQCPFMAVLPGTLSLRELQIRLGALQGIEEH